jgi:hypothetical protein
LPDLTEKVLPIDMKSPVALHSEKKHSEIGSIDLSRPGLKRILYFSLIFIVSIAVRLYFYQGPSGADDMIYFGVIKKILLGESIGEAIRSAGHWGIRIGMIFPIYGLMRCFGVSEWTSMLYPMIMSAITLITIYFICCKLFNSATGLIASAAYAILPLDVHYSGIMYPDGPIVFFSLIFLYFVYRISLDEAIQPGRALLAGLALGLGFLIRETSLFLFIAIPLLFFRSPKKKTYATSAVIIGAGFIVAIAIEMLCLSLLTGDPFARFKILFGQTHVMTPGQYAFVPRFYGYLSDGVIMLFATYWIAPIIIPLTIGSLFKSIFFTNTESQSSEKSHFLWILILSVTVLLFYLYAPVIGFTKPLERDERYLLVIMPFIAIAFGHIIYSLISHSRVARITGILLAAFYCLSSLIALESIVNKNSYGIQLISQYIKMNPAGSYFLPNHLKPILEIKNGLNADSKKIQTYSYDTNVVSKILEKAKGSMGKQCLFYIPEIHSAQMEFSKYTEWPEDKMHLVATLTPEPSLTCRMLRSQKPLYDWTPAFFKSRVCYAPAIQVYNLNPTKVNP